MSHITLLQLILGLLLTGRITRAFVRDSLGWIRSGADGGQLAHVLVGVPDGGLAPFLELNAVPLANGFRLGQT